MKTLLLTFALLTTQFTATFASELRYLTKDEYMNLMRENTVEFEEVTPGMSKEYSDTFSVYTNDVLTATCAQMGQDIIMATNNTHYLVYRKLQISADCDDHKKGETMEFLSWRKIRTIEQEETFIMNSLKNERITQLNKDTILLTGTVTDSDTKQDVSYKEIIRLGVSQFRAADHIEEGNYRYTLFWISKVDTSTIQIYHLLNRIQN
jgi:hypothetical protein